MAFSKFEKWERVMKDVKTILLEELNGLKISATEREILIEEFEGGWEDYLDYENDNPTAKEIRTFVKAWLEENAKEERPRSFF